MTSFKTSHKDLKDFLDEKVEQYNQPKFIESDPIVIPHQFSSKADIEIAGFLVATIAWGNRKSILKNGFEMIRLLDHAPHDFVMNHSRQDLISLEKFVHRTFNGIDFQYFIQALHHIYTQHGGLESIFNQYATDTHLQGAIHHLKRIFFEIDHPSRTTKHVADPFKGSSAKRINMFLRWMTRKDNQGVDFGIWTSISPQLLSCPLDVHSGNVARKLGLLNRKANDAKAVIELDTTLRQLDSNDPVKYDFALFGLGVFEGF